MAAFSEVLIIFRTTHVIVMYWTLYEKEAVYRVFCVRGEIMFTVALHSCDGCGEPIFPFREDVYTCPYCGEQYKHDELHIGCFIRITTTPLPRTVMVQNEYGIKTVTLHEVRERFDKANHALNAALAEYREACRLYEAARPRIDAAEME